MVDAFKGLVPRHRAVTDRHACRAAHEICRGLPPEGPPPAVLVEFALRSHGVVDPPPHMIVADIGGGARSVSQELRERVGAVAGSGNFRRIGIAQCRPLRSPGRRRIVIALMEGRVTIDPFPRRLPMSQATTLRLAVAEGLRDAQIVVATPAGEVRRPALDTVQRGRLQSQLVCKRKGVYRVEITAVGRYGSEVLANFPVYCAQPPPKYVEFISSAEPVQDTGTLEQRTLELTNGFRRRHGLPQLRSNPRLAEVARAHSQDMSDHHFVGHVSPRHGAPAERIRRAGVGYLVVRENVARAYSADEAMQELANSPAHRANLLSKDVTEIGIGVVVDRRPAIPVLLLTQEFIRPARPFTPQTAAEDVVKLINQRRREAGVAPLTLDMRLEQIARGHLDNMLDRGRQEANARLPATLEREGQRFRQVDVLMTEVVAVEGLIGAKQVLDSSPTHIGLAIRWRAGRASIVALLGRAR